MTIKERNNKLKHFITCLKCEVSGKHCDANCPTQYEAGHTGDIIENLEAISKVLEQDNNDRIKIVNKNVDINKLRNEIDLDTRVQVKHYTNTDAIINEVLGVIDKYKEEERI